MATQKLFVPCGDILLWSWIKMASFLSNDDNTEYFVHLIPFRDIKGFHIGDARACFALTSKIPPLGLTLNFDADVKKTTARHQCENCWFNTFSPEILTDGLLSVESNTNVPRSRLLKRSLWRPTSLAAPIIVCTNTTHCLYLVLGQAPPAVDAVCVALKFRVVCFAAC